MKKRMVYVFIGTEAELIKLLPVLVELEKQKLPFAIIASGQNPIVRSELIRYLDGVDVDIILSDVEVRQTVLGLLAWFFTTLFFRSRMLKKAFRSVDRKHSLLVVHGDTVSTLMGALIGKWYGLPVAHVEAGLRSFRFFSPFPEEMNRVLVSKFAHIHFCPNDWAANNLKKKKNSLIINTLQNTLLGSLCLSISVTEQSQFLQILPEKFFVFVMHRQENLLREKFVRQIIEKVVGFTQTIPCLFILHKPTEILLEKMSLIYRLKKDPGIILTRRLPYVEFMQVLNRCEFLITDGGSNQEESYYLGKPCLILREHSERIEGLGKNVLVSKNDFNTIDGFLAEYEHYRQPPLFSIVSPSKIIVETLVRFLVGGCET